MTGHYGQHLGKCASCEAFRLQKEAAEEFKRRYGHIKLIPANQMNGPLRPAPSLGQVPLVLGPSSWGFPGALPPGPVQIVCPPGTELREDGTCGAP